MKRIILVFAICLHLGGSYGSDDIDGVGAFAYQDAAGQRYEGTYGLRDGQVVNKRGNFPPNFSPPTFPNPDTFYPEYLNNLENILQEASPFIEPPPFIRPTPFRSLFFNKPFFMKRTFDNIDYQKLAYGAAQKAFDLTSNHLGYNQNFNPSRFPFGGDFPGFGGFPGSQGFSGFQGFPDFQMPNFDRSGDSAYASAAVGPRYTHQVAEINPPNENNPNINKFSSSDNMPTGGYSSVSSSSSVSTVNNNGQKVSTRRAETTVDKNGVITRYTVES